MPGTQKEVVFRFLAEPTDVNYGGKVFGGAVMKWIDQAGFACAVGWSGQYSVTAYVGGIAFDKPINIGDIAEVRARVLHTGTTSMHISVEVWARSPREDVSSRTTHCLMVFVAVDEQGNPVKVTPLQPASAREQALADYARGVAAVRRSEDAAQRANLAKLDAEFIDSTRSTQG
jgi:acyl-CoA hydrolase